MDLVFESGRRFQCMREGRSRARILASATTTATVSDALLLLFVNFGIVLVVAFVVTKNKYVLVPQRSVNIESCTPTGQ